jgi:hypothetical protein
VIEAAVAARGPDAPYLIHPVVGMTQPTLQSALFTNGTVTMLSDYEGADLDGDGTVPRVSATPIEYDGRKPDPAVYAPESHGSLQNALSVQTQILGLLTPVERPERFRDARGGLRLVLDDLYSLGEDVNVTVVAGVRRVTLVATVADADTRRMIAGPLPLQMASDGLTHTVQLPPLAEGCYRLTVAAVGEGAASIHSVHGLFLVSGDDAD